MNSQKRFTQAMPGLQDRTPILNHVFVDTESNWSQLDGNKSIMEHTLRFGCATWSHWNGKGFTDKDKIVFKERKEFWEWLELIKRRETTWVWAHNIAFDGTLLGLWEKLQENGVKLSFFTDFDLPAFFQCSIKGYPFQFLDSLNMFKSSLSSIGVELGKLKMEMPKQEEGLKKWIPYCQNDVDILRDIVEKWIQFIRKHDLGRMAPTIASQALVAYRTQFMQWPINLHNDEKATKLERLAYYGGLVEPQFIGRVKDSPVIEYDVNSLYPYIMGNEKFPNLLIGTMRRPNLKQVKKLMREYYVIANVKVSTTTGVFPVKYNNRLTFPYGEYWTTLHKPELERAIALGCVKEISILAWYTTATLFKKYVDSFFEWRMEYKEKGENTFDYICKLFMNSLYGKFGQRRGKWEPYSEELLRKMELLGVLPEGELNVIKEHLEQHDLGLLKFKHPLNDETYGCRRLLGVNQVLCGEGESPWSFPAISGAVTSYAREYVRNIQSMIGRKNLFYMDTDSFFVNRKGEKRLENEGMINDKTLGLLKKKTENEWMIIYSPKDYETPTEVKRKGIRAKAIWDEKNKCFVQEQWPGFRGLANQGFPLNVQVKMIRKRLKRIITTLHVGEDGWTRPLLLQIGQNESF